LTQNSPTAYSAPAKLALNQWALSGSWDVGAESTVLAAAPGKIAFRFHSRDLHLVAGSAKNDKLVRFKVLLDGAALGGDCGVDCAPDGTGEIRDPRLYQLIRQKGHVEDRTFEIEFLDPGAAAYVFTSVRNTLRIQHTAQYRRSTSWTPFVIAAKRSNARRNAYIACPRIIVML
jgi:hypothetical protein